MKIADKILAAQDTKEMTRRAIEAILAYDPIDPVGLQLKSEFEAEYNEKL